MSRVLILNSKEVEQIITPKLAIEAVEKAYVQKHKNVGSNWPMVFHDFETGKADLDIKSGDLSDVYGLKVVSWMLANSKKGLPQLMSTVLMFDRSNGQPIALLNGEALTGCRTGAAGTIGAKYLSRKDSRILFMEGCGYIAAYLVASCLTCIRTIKKVIIVNPLHPEETESQLADFKERVKRIMNMDGLDPDADIVAADSIENGCNEADIIFTATPSYKPLIKEEWVRPGTHFSCIGADMSGKEEIDPEIFKTAEVFGDDQDQCFTVGECEIPFRKGYIEKLDAEIGAVIVGDHPGRSDDNVITVFDSTGISLQDLSTAELIVTLAKEKGLGQYVEL